MKRLVLVLVLAMVLVLAGCVPPAPEWSEGTATQEMADTLRVDRLLLVKAQETIPSDKDEGMAWLHEVTELALHTDASLEPLTEQAALLLEQMYDAITIYTDETADGGARSNAYMQAQMISPMLNEAIRSLFDAAISAIIEDLAEMEDVIAGY